MNKKYRIGYTQGTFDLFHIGHLNLLENASFQCEKLIVGVNSDDLVVSYKKRETIIKQKDRLRIISALKMVDKAIIVDTLDKTTMYEILKFDVVFIGDDWINNQRWIQTSDDLKKIGVDVVFLPHTDGISTTMLRNKIDK